MEMTVLSQAMLDKAFHVRSAAQVKKELLRNENFRSLGDSIKKYCECEDKKKYLVDGLLEQHPEAKRDSIDRKVRNWLSGRTNSISKEDAFGLCVLLKLSLQQADDFLKLVTGEGIHWRSPEDIIWAYGISNEYSYKEIRRMLVKAEPLNKKIQRPGYLKPSVYTESVASKILPALETSEEEFFSVLEGMISDLGTFHNTAYRLFMNDMEILENAGQKDENDEKKGIKKKAEFTDVKWNSQQILEEYLFRKLIPFTKKKEDKAKDIFTDIQRSIRANWPDETTISKMKKRKTDITRKVLLLLFLATDGYMEDEMVDPDELDEEEMLTRDEVFENIYIRINSMLKNCGFQYLDPRSPFDWLILCCISVDDLWDIDFRMREILASIFQDEAEKT